MVSFPELGGMTEDIRSIWRSPRLWLVAAVIFLAFGFLSATQSYVAVTLRGRTTFTWPLAIAGTLPFWIAMFALLPLVIWSVHRVSLQGPRWKLAVLFHVGMSVVYAVLMMIGSLIPAHLWVNALGDRIPLAQGVLQVATENSVSGMVYYWAFAGLVSAVDYYNSYRNRDREAARAEVRAAKLEANLDRARLDWLRSQLNPHFLFNTLNSISTLARQHRIEAVVETIGELADLLRATLSHSDESVSLEAEIALLEKYTDLERVRFGERLTVEMEMGDQARRAAVPSLILQPLVENALKHGLGGVRGPVRITVRGMVRKNELRLRVSDSGHGFPPDWKEGVGLSNTRERLRQLYGDRACLTVVPDGPGATVEITMPYQPLPEAGEPQDAAPPAMPAAEPTSRAT